MPLPGSPPSATEAGHGPTPTGFGPVTRDPGATRGLLRRIGKPRTIAAAVMAVLVLLLGLEAYRVSVSRRPFIELLERMSDAGPAARLAARHELVTRTAESAPVLISIIRRGKTRWQNQILPWLDMVPLLADRRSRQLRLERNAIDALQRMGPAAAPAVLNLLGEDRHGGRETAMALLRSYGTNVCPALLETLDHPRPAMRAGAALTLGRFPSADLGSLDPLLEATRDPDASVRSAALGALAQMPERARESQPALLRALVDPSPEVQFQAVRTLRSFELRESPVIEALRGRLRDGTDLVRAEAAWALAGLGVEARDAAGDLHALLRSRSVLVARRAATALVQIDAHRDEAFARLRTLLRHWDPSVRSRTLDDLRFLGSKGQPLVPDILGLLENSEVADDRAAVFALRIIQPEAVPERFRQPRSRRDAGAGPPGPPGREAPREAPRESPR